VSNGALTVGGKLAIASTDAGATSTISVVSAVTGKVGKDLELTAAAGIYSGNLVGGNFSIGGNLHVEDQSSATKALLVELASLNVKKLINAVFPSGALTFEILTSGALKVGRDFDIINNFGGPA